MSENQMNMMEQRRFKNQIDLPFIGEEGQLKLKKSRVVVVGAGGKGIAAMRMLAAAGVGTIGICDNALIDETELSRQCMYGLTDLGKLRSIVAKQYLERINPGNTFNVHNLIINANNSTDIFANYDLIVDASSNWENKLEIAHLVEKQNIPLVTGKTNNQLGEVSVIHRTDISKLKSYFELRVKESAASNKKPPYAIPVILLSMTGSLIANEVFRVLLDIPSPLDGKKLIFSLDNYQFNIKDL